ncbi:hypothetical protein ACUBIP_26205, partial [Escherichia coli]|uniref:hypothetical protein n=1 Tax=Escherichia coli TaxID=562 RepID=UPI00403EAC5C
MNFLHLMNSKRFHITNAQLTELIDATVKVIHQPKVSVLQLTNVDMNQGTAICVMGNAHYNAVKLA